MVTAARRHAGRSAGLAELQARWACEDVLRASFRLIDEGHAVLAADLYAADGMLTLSDATTHAGHVTLRGADIDRAMRQRQADDRRTIHILTPSSFRLTAPDRAESECLLQVYGLGDDRTDGPKPRALSHVQDVLARGRDGAWRICARRITILAGRR